VLPSEGKRKSSPLPRSSLLVVTGLLS